MKQGWQKHGEKNEIYEESLNHQEIAGVLKSFLLWFTIKPLWTHLRLKKITTFKPVYLDKINYMFFPRQDKRP